MAILIKNPYRFEKVYTNLWNVASKTKSTFFTPNRNQWWTYVVFDKIKGAYYFISCYEQLIKSITLWIW